MNKLNVFYPDGAYRWWYRLSPSYVFRQLKWALQRVTRGFSDYDVYDLDHYYMELFQQSIEHLRTHKNGYPDGMSEEGWDAYLKEIVEHCRMALSNDYFNAYEEEYSKTCHLCFEYSEDRRYRISKTDPEYEELRQNWLNRGKEINTEKAMHRDKALDMIKAHFSDLWD